MAKKVKQNKRQGKKHRRETSPSNDPWLSMRSALIIMAVVSVGLAVFVAWNAIPVQGVLMGIVWGLIFGGANWLVFFGAYKFFKWTRGQ